jgi:hypothetical protein
MSNTLSATDFVGSGSALPNLNVSNAATGTLSISRGGIGTITLSANQRLIGYAATSFLQSTVKVQIYCGKLQQILYRRLILSVLAQD